MLQILGIANMKDLIIALAVFLVFLYIITGVVWLVQFYHWSSWWLIIPVMMIFSIRIRIKSE